MANKTGRKPMRAGEIPIPAHAHPLVRQFVQAMNSQKKTMREVARKAGLEENTVYSWRYRQNPKIENFEAAVNALGYELCLRERQR